MPALLSVWLGLASFALAVVMLAYRPAMSDRAIVLILYFGAPGALCLAGLTLWAHRTDEDPEPGILAQRLQSKVAITLALAAAAIVYGLIIGSHKIE